jgi:two-component system LytT family sensor kinase
MKKAVLLFIYGILTVASAQAQINWGDYSQSFTNESTAKPSAVGLILAIRKENNAFWEIREKSKHFDLLNDPSFRRLRPSKIVARTTFDTAYALVPVPAY